MCTVQLKNFYTDTPKLLLNEAAPELIISDVMETYPATDRPCPDLSGINSTLVRLAQCSTGVITEGDEVFFEPIPDKQPTILQTFGDTPPDTGTPPYVPPPLPPGADDEEEEEFTQTPGAAIGAVVLALIVCVLAVLYALKYK